MNKQIQELAKQAGIFYYRKGKLQVDTEKFAELIVRECSQMVVNSHPDDLPFVGGKMLVHFRVEE